jgi:SAM-dependent methyltransferase
VAEPSENRAFWESEAANWIAWAREPDHDDYWIYSEAFFRDIVPATRGRTLEIGCGEGRVTRDLRARGHDVFAIDGAPSMVRAALAADAAHPRYAIADAARLPFTDASFDHVVAYNSLMDMDDMPATVAQAARVLKPGGAFCICVTHPMADAGAFESREADARFVIDRNYLEPQRFDETFERSGLRIRFRGSTFPLEAYAAALEDAELVIERIREPRQTDEAVERDPAEARWQRIANFLFIRARKLSGRRGASAGPSASGVLRPGGG